MSRPEIAATFRPNPGGFTSCCDPHFSCPPWVIAMVATDRVRPGALALPTGYGIETLGTIRQVAGAYGEDVFISGRQAAELAEIGRQLLVLDDLGEVEPSLSRRERQSVEHLIRTSCQS